ncbi:Chondroitin proteoglycan 1 [Orchesella cincta]|uniref:Chondroitin proteoglycan 1 n=1 Tax=Orchesella cincta TaxID=48709 RepID=A0A1D2MY11_ORCCI|nr:Chondroitin proteoglycan 1 [Orchesella cincta]
MTLQYKVYTVAVLSASPTRLLIGLITLLTILLGDGLVVYAQSRSIDPCSTKSGTAPHDTHCDKYYTCVRNVTSVVDCPNGLVYIGGGGRSGRGNQLFGSCEYDFNVDCSGRPKRMLAASGAVAQKKGTEQINPCDVKGKIVADVTYCDRYWECVNGQPELYDCPTGLAF